MYTRQQIQTGRWSAFANIDRLQERRQRETKIGGQTERKECCLLIALIHKRAPSQQSVSRTLPWVQHRIQPTPPFFSPKSPNPKPPPLYQHKKMQHGTFLFTLACKPPTTPPNTHTHTHTHPRPPPFPPLYQLKGIWLLPSDSPRLKVPFTLPQFTKRSDYGKQKYCVRAHFFCAWAKRCERHKNSRGRRVPDKVTSGQTNLTPFLMPERENLCCSEWRAVFERIDRN